VATRKATQSILYQRIIERMQRREDAPFDITGGFEPTGQYFLSATLDHGIIHVRLLADVKRWWDERTPYELIEHVWEAYGGTYEETTQFTMMTHKRPLLDQVERVCELLQDATTPPTKIRSTTPTSEIRMVLCDPRRYQMRIITDTTKDKLEDETNKLEDVLRRSGVYIVKPL